MITLKKNTYVMQIATLMSGTLAAQAITLAFIPIITRLYTPEQFGVYSLFFSLVSIVGLVSSWKYDQAIMLPKSEADAQALLFLSFLIMLGMTLFTAIGTIIGSNTLTEYFNGKSRFVPFIPIGVFLIGSLQIVNAYLIRQQRYKKIASTKVVNSVVLSGIQSSSIFFLKIDGLVFGKLAAEFVSLTVLLREILKNQTINLMRLSKSRIKKNALIHSNFPKYQSFTVFINALSQNLPTLLFAYYYSTEVAGLYALTVRVLKVPVGLVGSSTKEVFYQKASKLHSNNESFLDLYTKTTLGLIKLFVLPFLVVLFFGDYLFVIVFGDEWRESGEIAQILILWFLFAFVNSPSIASFSILGLQKIQLSIEFFSLIFRFLAIYIGHYLYNSYTASITYFLISSVLINIVLILYIYSQIKFIDQKSRN